MAPYAAMRDRMYWRDARTGRVICQCAARVNPFFISKLVFWHGHTHPANRAAVVRQGHYKPNQENDKGRPQRPPPVKLR